VSDGQDEMEGGGGVRPDCERRELFFFIYFSYERTMAVSRLGQ